jgi:hypothetical protein
VEQASTAYGHHLGLGHPQEPGGRLGELGHARGVAVQVGRLEVDDVGEATGDLVELTLGDRAAQAGFGGDHGDVEVVEPFQLLQQLAPGAGERAGHVRVEDPSRPSPDGLDGRVRSEVGEGHRRIGDRREACRQRELLAAEAVWPPTAVPALEDRPQRRLDRLVQPEGLAMLAATSQSARTPSAVTRLARGRAWAIRRSRASGDEPSPNPQSRPSASAGTVGSTWSPRPRTATSSPPKALAYSSEVAVQPTNRSRVVAYTTAASGSRSPWTRASRVASRQARIASSPGRPWPGR